MNDKQKAELFRDMFKCRPDVYGRQKIFPDGRRAYYPVCGNAFTKGCHLGTNDGISCSDCTIQKYTPVTNESVLMHIHGKEAHSLYPVCLDGNVNFAAADFDCKEGREDEGYFFSDVQKFAAVLKGWGVHYGLARSTTNGFHGYMFMDRPILAAKARAIILEAFDKAGFMELSRRGVKSLPECFPKSFSPGLNGIKVPMIEPSFARERNCWVDDNNNMIPPDQQWEYFAGIQKNKVEDIEKLIVEKEIPVLDLTPMPRGGRAGRSGAHQGHAGDWQPPLSGSFEKVLEGCGAFRNLMAKIENKYVPRHDEGFSLWHAAMNTSDGMAIFQQRVRGWGETESDKRQLEQSLKNGYAPWSCRKMQEKGICATGTKCFEKKPPIDMVDGKAVVREGVPPDQWPEPSPIRYAFGRGEDFLAKLQREADILAGESDLSLKSTRLRELISRSMVFDVVQQDSLKHYIAEKKIAKRADVNKSFKEASQEKVAELKAKAEESSDMISHNDVVFMRNGHGGYSVVKFNKGSGSVSTQISDFEIEIKKEIQYVEDEQDSV